MRLNGPAIVVEEEDLDIVLAELDEAKASVELVRTWAKKAMDQIDGLVKDVELIKSEEE